MKQYTLGNKPEDQIIRKMRLVNNDEYLKIWDKIEARNNILGWARFDYSDLDNHILIRSLISTPFHKLIRSSLRGLDVISPVIFHKLMGMKREMVPSGYYHVGMAYLHRENIDFCEQVWSQDKANIICNIALENRLDTKYVCWGHPYPSHGLIWKKETQIDAPPSCAHHVARIGTLLLETGMAHSKHDFIENGINAAHAMLTYHNWHCYEDGTCTVSYYPYTEDETINTCADVAVLFASIPLQYRPNECQEKLENITRMVLNEQQIEGSWTYCTNRHYQKYFDGKIIDNHHNAMIIQALAKILIRGNLNERTAQEVRLAIERGLDYYQKHFYKEDGSGYYYPDSKRVPANIVGYCEGLAAIYWVFKSKIIGKREFGKRVRAFAVKMLNKALTFYDPVTGDVACAKILGRNYHLQSLRWGSGPLMEGIIYTTLLNMSIK